MARAESPSDQAAKESADSSRFNAADNAWMLTSSALVLMMTAPGLALFYCGLVRRKNVLERHDAVHLPDVPDDGALGRLRLHAGLRRRWAVDRRRPLPVHAGRRCRVDRQRVRTGRCSPD